MGSKYHSVDGDEKFDDVFITHRSSTSESLGSTLLEDEEDSRLTETRKGFNIRWMWLGHVVLLSLSFAMFVGAYYTRLSTLRHVQQFSAYCKCIFSNA
jgi:hypothetical protein